MSKGLPRSLARGDALKQEIIKKVISINTTVTVSAASTAVGFGTAVIGDFEEGNVLFLGAVSNFTFAGSGSDANLTADWEGDYAIGSTATADVTLDGTDVDIIPSTAIAAATAEVSPVTRGANATQVMLNNTDGSLEINLNLLIDAADITDDESVDITVTGELYIAYIMLGDD